jgi:hypothetical protein
MDINKTRIVIYGTDKPFNIFFLTFVFVNNFDLTSILGTVRYSYFENLFFPLFYLIVQ